MREIREYVVKVTDAFVPDAFLQFEREWAPEQELIRCRDCVHWIPGTITDKDDFIQPRCKRNGGGWSADEYCSCAERREEACTSNCMS